MGARALDQVWKLIIFLLFFHRWNASFPHKRFKKNFTYRIFRIDLVNHPDGRPVDADLALKTIIRLLSRNSNKHNNLDSVDLSGCQRLTDRGLAILARRCPNLTRLEVQGCPNITNGGLMDLLTKCPIIDHLDVTGVYRFFSLFYSVQ